MKARGCSQWPADSSCTDDCNHQTKQRLFWWFDKMDHHFTQSSWSYQEEFPVSFFFFPSSQKTINCNVVLFSQNYSEQLFEETTELFREYETKQRYNIETNNLILCSWNSLDLSEYDHETSGCPAVSGTETFVCGCWGELRIRLVPARYLGNLSCCCSWAAVVTCQGEVSSWTSPVSGFNVGLIGVFKRSSSVTSGLGAETRWQEVGQWTSCWFESVRWTWNNLLFNQKHF